MNRRSLQNHLSISRLNIYAGIALAVFTLLFVWIRHKDYLWDFYSYYSAGFSFQQGSDPYYEDRFSDHFAEYGTSIGPHAYPPITLWLLRPLPILNPVAAAGVWNILKLGALLLLFSVMQKKFVRWTSVPYALPFFVLGLNAALFWDFIAGNISLFEQTLIALALAALVDGKRYIFAALIVLAAQLKGPPVLFLGLLLLVDRKPAWKVFGLSVAAFAAIFSLNYLCYPDYTRSFFGSTNRLINEAGVHSASSFIFLQQCLGTFKYSGIDLSEKAIKGIHYVYVATVALISFIAVQRYKKVPDYSRAALILFLCVAYAIVLPRLKSYQYILMLFPTLYIIKENPRFLAAPLVLFMALFPHPETPLPGPIHRTFGVLNEYMAILTLIVAWTGYVVLFLRPAKTQKSEVSARH